MKQSSKSGNIKILYEDNHILAVYKPAGIAVQAARRGEPDLFSLTRRHRETAEKKPGRAFLAIVHRIDRPVAGVVVFCKTSKSASRLSDSFRDQQVTKRYLAVVHGVPEILKKRLECSLVKSKKLKARLAEPGEKGKPASLTYSVMGAVPDRSLLEIFPETGRFHQIRFQLANEGFPILGDGYYGAPDSAGSKSIALWAERISFKHPVGNSPLTIESPRPRNWPWPPPKKTNKSGSQKKQP